MDTFGQASPANVPAAASAEERAKIMGYFADEPAVSADSLTGGAQGLRFGSGGYGFQPSASAVAVWSTDANTRINTAASDTNSVAGDGPTWGAREMRLSLGLTVSDGYGPVNSFGPTAEAAGATGGATGALRQLAGQLPNVKSGYFTDMFTNNALNSDVPTWKRELYGATLPLVLLEQGGIGLINAPGKLTSMAGNALGVFTETTAEGKIISGLTAIRDGAEGIAGSLPLIPASRLTAPIGFGRSSASSAAAVIDAAGEVPLGYTRAYRAVSQAEYDSVVQTGRFTQGPNALEGKWFADDYENALRHGDALEGMGNYRIFEADLPDSAPSLYRMPNLDGRGPARYIHMDDLIEVKPRPYNGEK